MSDNEEDKTRKIITVNEKQQKEEKECAEIPEKNDAFLIFKAESIHAKEIEAGIIQNSNDLKSRKAEARDLLEKCNLQKGKIEEYKVILNDKKLNKLQLGDDMTNVIDEEEYKVIDSLKGLKEYYKDSLDRFKTVKSEIAGIKNNLDILKLKFVDTFENWFSKKYGIRIEEHFYKKISLKKQ